ncbi:MAG: hypothetical protein QOD74_995 [Variibacter sp.]|jgi:hypothetical protein|nr:hypothetical protein [Variibacter sp.]
MSELAPREGDTGTIPFRCAQCGVTYFTDDHVPVSGRANQTAT